MKMLFLYIFTFYYSLSCRDLPFESTKDLFHSAFRNLSKGFFCSRLCKLGRKLFPAPEIDPLHRQTDCAETDLY